MILYLRVKSITYIDILSTNLELPVEQKHSVCKKPMLNYSLIYIQLYYVYIMYFIYNTQHGIFLNVMVGHWIMNVRV